MPVHCRQVRRAAWPAAVGFIALTGNPLFAQTGPFTNPSGPFLANGLPGVSPVGTTQIAVDTTGDGFPDHTYDLPPEVRPDGAYTIHYRLSPTREVLISRKFTSGSGIVPGCSDAWDNRIYFHRLDPPPGTGMTAFTGEQGACLPGPIAQGPWFFDPSPTAPVRTALFVGAPTPAATPTSQAILWADLVHGEVNLDASTYDYGVQGIQFAPAGNAAFLQTANPFGSDRRYYFIDLCKSPIAGSIGLTTGPLPYAGSASAQAISSGGHFWGQINVSGVSGAYRTIPLQDCFTPHACCLPDESCEAESPILCQLQGGTTRAAVSCIGISCATPAGACCDGAGGCEVATQAECTGAYQGDGTNCPMEACAPPPPVVEGCCLPSSGQCLDVTAAECAALGGVNHPAQTCDALSCPAPAGTEACCTPTFGCVNFPPSTCTSFVNGIPQGPGSNCFSNAICPQAVLTISKTAPPSIPGGEEFDYVIHYGNFGPDAAVNVQVRETLPAGVTLVHAGNAPGEIAPAIAGGVITWEIGTLPAGTVNQTVTVTVRAHCSVTNNQIVNNSYRISAAPGGTVNGTAVSTAVTPPSTGAPVDIAVSSIDLNGGSLQAGDLLEHTITLTNGGATGVNDVRVTDVVGNDVTVGAASVFEAVISAAGGQFVVSPDAARFQWRGDVPAASVLTLVFTARVVACPAVGLVEEALNQGGTLVARTSCGGALGQATPTDRFTLLRDVRVEMEALNLNQPQPPGIGTTQVARAGTTLQFEIRLIQETGIDHPAVAATLTIPPGISPDPPGNPLVAPPPGATYNPATRTIDYAGPLAAGQTLSIRWNGVVAGGVTCNDLTHTLGLTGSVDGCNSLSRTHRILVVPSSLPAGPHIVGGDHLGTLWTFDPAAGGEFVPLLCNRAELLTGLGRGPGGDIWITDVVSLARFNPTSDPPVFEMLSNQAVIDLLGLTNLYDVVVDPANNTAIVVGRLGSPPGAAAVRRYDPATGQVTFILDDPALVSANRAIVDADRRLVMIAGGAVVRLDLAQPAPITPGTHTAFSIEVPSDFGGLPGNRAPAYTMNLELDTDGDYLITVLTRFTENFGDPLTPPVRYTSIYSLLKLDRDNPAAQPTILIERLAGTVSCSGNCPGAPADFSEALFGYTDLFSARAAAVRSACDVLIGSAQDPFLRGIYRTSPPAGQALGSGILYGLTAEDVIYRSAGGGGGSPLVGDFDDDCGVDRDDVTAFAACASRANVEVAPACTDKDLDGDGDADLQDFATLQRCLFGPGNPVKPECAH